MSSGYYKTPFVFFLVIILVLLSALGYLYFHDYTPSVNIVWSEASLKITTDWGACPKAFPCYETYFLNSERQILHNDEVEGKLSERRFSNIIKQTFTLYQNEKCTPFYDSKVKQIYELNIDGKIYKFENDYGCKEMQNVLSTFHESINI